MKNMKIKNIITTQSQLLLVLTLLLFSLITIPTIILSLYLRTTPNNITSIICSTSCFKPSVKLIDDGKYIKLEIKDNYSINRTLYSQYLMIIDPSVFLKFNGNEFTLQVILRVGNKLSRLIKV